MSNDEEKRNTFKISYHRDFTSLSNENTDRYIDESNSNNSITYIEVDARLTKDGRIIVAHSNDLIVDGKHVRISDLTYEKARDLSISDRNKLINVREAAFLFNGGVIITPRFDGDYVPLCNELIRELVPIKNNLNIIIQSTCVEVLSYIRRNSALDCQLVITDKNYQYANRFERLSIDHYILTEKLYKELAIREKKLAITTINNERDIDTVLNYVGDGYKDIIFSTTCPDLIYSKLKEKDRCRQESL